MAETVRVAFPFHKTESYACGAVTWYRWRPGVRWDGCRQDGDCDAFADGIGAMLLTEIGRYTPPGFGPRVFYTRQFALPDGTLIGKPRLRVMGAAGFTRLCRGYRYPVELTDERANVTMEPDGPNIEDMADAASY